jgi:outer membrane lipoprotein-sorting protein
MQKQKIVLGLIAILVCSSLMISGCMQQNTPSDQNPPSTETLQQILKKAETIKSVYYEISMSLTTNGTLMQNTTMKIWQKTPYLKEEVSYTTGNITTNLTIIKRPDAIYRYDIIQNKYIPVAMIVIPQPSTGDVANDLLNNQTITTLGNETIDGKTTTVIQYTPNQAGNYSTTTTKMWIWKEKGIPLKTRVTMTKQGIITTSEYEYRNYSFSDIPDSTFNIS